jgi:hypothetical protein
VFRAGPEAIDAGPVLYQRTYADIAPSFVFPFVTYLDVAMSRELITSA